MQRTGVRQAAVVWSRELVLLAVAVFMLRFGEGMTGGVRANFFVDTLGLTGGQVLWLEGAREVPGLLLIVIAAFLTQLPLAKRGGYALLLMGLGFMAHALVRSYLALMLISVLASLGNHIWMPLSPALGLSLATRETSGRVLGRLASVGALASIVGMGALTLVSWLASDVPLGSYYGIGGGLMVVAAVVVLRMPDSVGATEREQPRMLLNARYWLFYVLTFFEGARKQVLHSFGTLVLVQSYEFEVWQISLVLLTSGVINFVSAPWLGAIVDRVGERACLTSSYVVLALSCLGFGLLDAPLVLAGLVVLQRFLGVLGMGLNTYVHRTAPDEELTPTLTAGISINHVTSVIMPLIAGAVLPFVGYEGVFIGTGALILLSVPFAAAMRIPEAPVASPAPVMAK